MPRRRGKYKASKRFVAATKSVDLEKGYTVEEAIERLKTVPLKCKFDESVDLAIKLNIDSRQADQLVRGSFSLPKGAGKEMRVICFAEGAIADKAKEAGAVEVGGEDLAKKVQGGWMEFDVAVAHPSCMRFVGRLGKVLGPKGLMPSPKSGTVTPDVVKAVSEFKAGKLEYRNDEYGNIHVNIGKLSFDQDDLILNANAMISHIVASRPQAVKGHFVDSAHLTSTMGPGLQLSM